MFISMIKAYRLENISKRLSLLCLVVLVLVCVDQFCRVLEVSLGACLHAYECVSLSLSLCLYLCLSLCLCVSPFLCLCLSVCFSVTVCQSLCHCLPPPPSLSHCLSVPPLFVRARPRVFVCVVIDYIFFAVIVCYPFAVELTTSRRCLDLLVFSSFLSLCRLPVQELTRPMAIAEHGKPCFPGRSSTLSLLLAYATPAGDVNDP